MPYTKQDYLITLRKEYPEKKITLLSLIETIIQEYGKDNSIKEDKINNILDILLGELKDLAFSVSNDQKLASKFKFYFDTKLGEGFVVIK